MISDERMERWRQICENGTLLTLEEGSPWRRSRMDKIILELIAEIRRLRANAAEADALLESLYDDETWQWSINEQSESVNERFSKALNLAIYSVVAEVK